MLFHSLHFFVPTIFDPISFTKLFSRLAIICPGANSNSNNNNANENIHTHTHTWAASNALSGIRVRRAGFWYVYLCLAKLHNEFQYLLRIQHFIYYFLARNHPSARLQLPARDENVSNFLAQSTWAYFRV